MVSRSVFSGRSSLNTSPSPRWGLSLVHSRKGEQYYWLEQSRWCDIFERKTKTFRRNKTKTSQCHQSLRGKDKWSMCHHQRPAIRPCVSCLLRRMPINMVQVYKGVTYDTAVWFMHIYPGSLHSLQAAYSVISLPVDPNKPLQHTHAVELFVSALERWEGCSYPLYADVSKKGDVMTIATRVKCTRT